MPSDEGSAPLLPPVVVPEPNDPRSTLGGPESENENKPTPSSVIRDEDYYWSDGNCIIRVEDRLFKIHRYLLERDSVVFQTLFSLPQPESADDKNGEIVSHSVEGQSDENPIVCHDPVDDFKALCWILYARPQEISELGVWQTVDLVKLLRATIISSKYEIEGLHDWLFRLVDTHSRDKPDHFLGRCGDWMNVDRFLNTCYDRQQIGLAGHIERLWLDKIQISEDPNESLGAFKAALDAAENSSYLHQFHGLAYYRYLLACNVFNAESSTSRLPSAGLETAAGYIDHFPFQTGGLNWERSARLSQGLFSLMRLRSKLSIPSDEIKSAFKCPEHPSKTVVPWRDVWATAHKTKELNPRRFLRLQHFFADSSAKLCACSVEKLNSKIKAMITLFDETLPGQFMIPHPDENEPSAAQDPAE